MAVARATDGHASEDADSRCLRPRRDKRFRLVGIAADGVGKAHRVVERHEAAGARSEHVLGVPVGRRDDSAAGRDCECQRARRDLLLAAIRRDEDVGCREQVGQLVDREEPVVELDVLGEIELEHTPLEHQAVGLALAPLDVRVCSSRNDVDDLGVTLDHRGQRLDHRLEALAGRDQAEGREQEAVVGASVRARRGRSAAQAGARGQAGRRAMRHHPDLLLGAGAALDEQSMRGIGHHDHQLRLGAQVGEHFRLMRRRPREHRMQRDDERLSQVLGEGQHVLAVASSEDPILVLQQHDVDVEPSERPRSAHVVATYCLSDRRDHPAPLRA